MFDFNYETYALCMTPIMKPMFDSIYDILDEILDDILHDISHTHTLCMTPFKTHFMI